MATLVLASLGTAIGGPVGGAIGSLVGQSIDRSVFAAAPRVGPRLGDLSVQTSDYGTQIPKVYGRMRVAGTVVWASDLKETLSSETAGKGSTSVTYAYSVSLAVALSSRSANGIGRIWADGKLIRGEAGDFKIRTGFRFYCGDADQVIDPLIAASEGLRSCPAYRNLALAVFENLDLTSFGNRIPILTFELFADEDVVPLSDLLRDASAGVIAAACPGDVIGYAAHGADIRDALATLVDTFDIALHDDGVRLVGDSVSPAMQITDLQLGCAVDGETMPRVKRWQDAKGDLPAAVSITHYEADRDYQSGQKRASIAASGRRHRAIELPAVLDAGMAKALASDILGRAWAQREHIQVCLPIEGARLAIGDTVRLGEDPTRWAIGKVGIERLIVTLDLKRAVGKNTALLKAEAGRALADKDQVASPTILAVADIPAFLGAEGAGGIVFAASRASEGWSAVPAEARLGVSIYALRSAARKGVLGRVRSVDAQQGSAAVLDRRSSMIVELACEADWLESCDDDALINGTNLAVVGRELLQFRTVVPLGQRRFRLSDFLRGRSGTEEAIRDHAIDESFLLLKADTLTSIPLSSTATGATLIVVAGGLHDPADGIETSLMIGNEALRPPSPVHLSGRIRTDGIHLSWIRRSRTGWAWVDGMDAAIGEARESYRVTLRGSAGWVEKIVAIPECTFPLSDLDQVGSDAHCEVIQIGDQLASRPAILPIIRS